MGDTRADVRLLLVDDDPVFTRDLVVILGGQYALQTVADGEAAVAYVADTPPDLILLDLDLGNGRPDGFAVLKRLRELPDTPPVIMLTGSADIGTVVASVKAGAFHYCTKPPNPAHLRQLITMGLHETDLRRQMHLLRDEVHRLQGEFVVSDRRLRIVMTQIEQVAPTPSTVLITGPSGAGKEMVARRIHALSPRANGPFVGVNCAAIPDNLIESELFGHERGAFTDATTLHRGKFELARGGTLFLDEIADAPARLHTKLLRVLEERTFTRVGGEASLPTDVRVLAATSKDLAAEVTAGRFRAELFYRLNVFPIAVPGLDDRPQDIEPLALHFLARATAEVKKPIVAFRPEALTYLRDRKWPGNVRELRNLIESAVIRCQNHEIAAADLAYGDCHLSASPSPYHEAKDQAMRAFKTAYLLTQLRNANSNITLAADRSGISRQAFSKMLKDEGLSAEEMG